MKKKILLSLLVLLLCVGSYLIGYNGNKKIEPVENKTVIVDRQDNDYYLSIYNNLLSLKDTVYVIGHKSPDADTVTSSIVLADLLNKIGIKAEPRVAEKLNDETAAILKYIGVNEPQILEDATGLNLFLVDHSEYSQTVNGADKANIVGIIDHHNVGDVKSADVINASFAPVGSTTMLIYSKYKELNVEADEKEAALMCAGLMSDTNNLKYKDSVTKLDETLFNELLNTSKINRDELNVTRLKAKVNYENKTDKELLFIDYKEYQIDNKKAGVGIINTVGEEDSSMRIEKMKKAMDENYKESGIDYLYLMIHDYITDKQYILCKGDNAKEICEKALNVNFDDYLTLDESISRKTVFVPAITKVIEEQK